jgi:hypothetical protein
MIVSRNPAMDPSHIPKWKNGSQPTSTSAAIFMAIHIARWEKSISKKQQHSCVKYCKLTLLAKNDEFFHYFLKSFSREISPEDYKYHIKKYTLGMKK